MQAARGKVIKILFQDDFLNGCDSLGSVANAFANPAVNWLLSGCEHSSDGINLNRPFVPRWNKHIFLGHNTVSSPSVLAVRRHLAPSFDEDLIWLMDGEYYWQCYLKFGDPTILQDPLVVNRLHPDQLSNRITGSLKRRELRHVRTKYYDQMTWGDRWFFWRQMRKTWS